MKYVFSLEERDSQSRGMNHVGAALNTSRRYTYIELVASNIVALDIANETIILPVLCLSDSSPGSTVLDRWQGV